MNDSVKEIYENECIIWHRPGYSTDFHIVPFRLPRLDM